MPKLRIPAHAGPRLAALALAIFLIAAADSPVTTPLPSIDQIVGATPSGLLALGIFGFLRGWFIQGDLYERQVVRADTATAAAATANETTANAIRTVSELSAAHKAEVDSLRVELARLQPARKQGAVA